MVKIVFGATQLTQVRNGTFVIQLRLTIWKAYGVMLEKNTEVNRHRQDLDTHAKLGTLSNHRVIKSSLKNILMMDLLTTFVETLEL